MFYPERNQQNCVEVMNSWLMLILKGFLNMCCTDDFMRITQQNQMHNSIFFLMKINEIKDERIVITLANGRL